MKKEYYSTLYAQVPDAWVVISAEVPGTKRFQAGRPVLARNVASSIEDEAAKANNNLFATFNLFGEAPTSGRGKAADVRFVVAAFLDIDLGESGLYADAKNPSRGLAAVKAEISKWGLPEASAITSSGHGLHLEWRLDHPFEIKTDADRIRAGDFLRGFNAFAIEKGKATGWKLDSMGDLARVKRAVGSQNWKQIGNPRPVEVIELDPARMYALEELEAFTPIRSALPTKPPSRKSADSSDESLSDWESIEVGCDFAKHAVEDAATLSEPEWYALLSLTARCSDGEAVSQTVSAAHPSYSEQDTTKKVEHALEASGPRTCADIHGGAPAFAGCAQCPFWGKITSPLQLGRASVPLVELMHDNVYDLGSTRFFDIETVSPQNEHAFRMAHLHKVGNPVNDFAKSHLALKVSTVDYLPGKPRISHEAGRAVLNTYTAPSLVPASGSCETILGHFDYLIPDAEDREHALSYFAHLVQNPGEKITSALLIFGPQGTGKNMALDWVRAIVGASNTVISPASLIGSRWQGGNGNTLLLAFNEVMGVTREHANGLKEWITEERVTTEAKGVDPFSIRTPRGLVLFSNHHDALALESGDRRFAVIETATSPRETAYYDHLAATAERELPAFAHFLLTRDLSGFNPKAKAPVSAAKKVMVSLGRTPLEAAIEEAMDAGANCFNRDFGTAEEVRAAIEARGWNYRQPSTTSVGAVLAGLGAESLDQMRVPGHGRLRFWVWRNQAKWSKAGTSEVAHNYLDSLNPAKRWEHLEPA